MSTENHAYILTVTIDNDAKTLIQRFGSNERDLDTIIAAFADIVDGKIQVPVEELTFDGRMLAMINRNEISGSALLIFATMFIVQTLQARVQNKAMKSMLRTLLQNLSSEDDEETT